MVQPLNFRCLRINLMNKWVGYLVLGLLVCALLGGGIWMVVYLANRCAVKNCTKCAAGTTGFCSTCASGYLPSALNDACNACFVENCTQCAVGDAGTCQTCKKGHVPTDGKCLCNIKNCAECAPDDSDHCSVCATGYTLSQTKQTCIQCNVTNCLMCQTNDPSECAKCASGFKSGKHGICE